MASANAMAASTVNAPQTSTRRSWRPATSPGAGGSSRMFHLVICCDACLTGGGCGRPEVQRIWQVPYVQARRIHILLGGFRAAAVSLRPVARDNHREMGGRVSSPTFVGRVEELRVLEAARVRAANAEPAVVLVGGEAGVGKTRLVAELTGRCAADGARVLAGGCVPVAEGGLPFAPIVEALRGLLAELGAGALRELTGPSWPELARLLPALGEPGSTAPSDQEGQSRLFELLLGLLGRLGARAPLVLVVEDLHWADRSTRDLLAFLARNLRRERVLLVVTYRSDETGRRRLGPYLAELDRGSRVERIELSRFQRWEVMTQLTGILGAAPAAGLVDAVFARSEGNAFFTEELLAAVRAGSQELPTTLRELLHGRVEALPERPQQLLGVAAVVGRRVPHRLLAAVAGLDDRRLDGALRQAVAHQLLVSRPDQDGYEFRHALLQEVVYSGLLPGERARLHAQVAATIAGHPGWAGGSAATVAAEVAEHWVRAGNLERALPATIDAAAEAERAYAFAEALRHYQRALDLWDRVSGAAELAPFDRATLQERAAEAASLILDQSRAVELVRAALAGVDRQRDPVRVALLLERLGRYLWLTLDATALAAYQEAVGLVPAEPPSAERARVLAGYAQILGLLGRHVDSRQTAEEALAAARQAGARWEEGRALAFLGVELAKLGNADGGLAYLRDAVRIAHEVADVDGFGWACFNLAWASEGAGRLEEALAAALEGAEASRQLGSAWQDTLQEAAAWFEFLLGRWDDADRRFRTVLERDRFSDTMRVHARLERARLDIARGDFAAARCLLEEAQALAAAAGSDQFDAQFSWPLADTRAELALWEGHDEEAFEAVTQGLAAMARAGSETNWPVLFALGLAAAAGRAERASARRATAGAEAARCDGDELLARLEAARGPAARRPEAPAVLLQCRAEQARLHGRPDPAAWAAAAAQWEELGQPYPAARARFRQAEAMLATRAPRARVEEALWAAHTVAVRLGASPLRRELELLAQRGRLRLGAAVEPVSQPAQPSAASMLGLTRREAEVLALVAAGRSNRQIGEALFITPKTASIHVSRILAKLGVSGRVEAAAVAHRLGLAK
jgi:DNA-binding CsgD family transcriptional regulator